VIATHLSPDDQVQGSLLAPLVDRAKRDRLMATLDQLNRHLRPDAVKFAALGLNPTWTPRADYFSQRYTTHWQELATVTPWVPPVGDLLGC
jgi:DNA polymerase V